MNTKKNIADFVRRFLKNRGYELIKTSLYPIQKSEAVLEVKLEYIIADRFLNSRDFFFIQVGAMDGINFDPIFPFVKKYKWKGILIEPQKCYFEQLVETYSDLDCHLLFLNKAISESELTQDFYRINEKIKNLPAWTKGIASFNFETLLSYQKQIPNIEDFIITEKVETINMNNLIVQHGVTKIDLLQIDTEGYDAEIIKMIDFNKIKPSIINYESKNLSTTVQQNLTNMLSENNYKLYSNGHDTIAYLA